jgi:hypothetical protein
VGDSMVPVQRCTSRARSRCLSRLGSWLLVGACAGLLALYVALHTRELLLVAEWLTSD